MEKLVIADDKCIGSFGHYSLFEVESVCGKSGIAWLPSDPANAQQDGALVQWDPKPGKTEMVHYSFQELTLPLQRGVLATEVYQDLALELLKHDPRYRVLDAAHEVVMCASPEMVKALIAQLDYDGYKVDPKYRLKIEALLQREAKARVSIQNCRDATEADHA